MWSITVKRSRKLTICGVTLAVVLAFINAPTKAIAVESEPNPSEAEAAMVVDAQGDVLYEKNPDSLWEGVYDRSNTPKDGWGGMPKDYSDESHPPQKK